MGVSKDRKKLHSYIADLDEKKVKAMLTLFEDEVMYQTKNTISETEKRDVLKREQNRVSGKSKTYTLPQAKKLIRRKKP